MYLKLQECVEVFEIWLLCLEYIDVRKGIWNGNFQGVGRNKLGCSGFKVRQGE